MRRQIITSAIVFLIIVIVMFFVRKGKRQKPLTPLGGLAFGFVIAGIVFGDSRVVGYSLIGIGIVLAIIDAIMKRR